MVTIRALAFAIGTMVVVSSWGSMGMADQWFENGKPVVEHESWQKWIGGFGAQLLITDKPEKLFAAWNEPTLGVDISTTEIAIRGVPIVAVVVFTGCKANLQGLCNAVVDFSITKPDGSPYGEEQLESELWINKPAPPRGVLELGVQNLGIEIEPNDPDGLYTVKARVRDNHAKWETVLERTFVVWDKPGK